MGHILPKRKKWTTNFLYVVQYMANYQNIDTKLKKCGGKFYLFLPWTQNRNWLPRPSFYSQVQNSSVLQYIFISSFDFEAKLELCPKKFMPQFGPSQKSHLLIWFRGFRAVGANILRWPGIEAGSLEDQVYNSEIAKNVASDPKCLTFFMTANFRAL